MCAVNTLYHHIYTKSIKSAWIKINTHLQTFCSTQTHTLDMFPYTQNQLIFEANYLISSESAGMSCWPGMVHCDDKCRIHSRPVPSCRGNGLLIPRNKRLTHCKYTTKNTDMQSVSAGEKKNICAQTQTYLFAFLWGEQHIHNLNARRGSASSSQGKEHIMNIL